MRLCYRLVPLDKYFVMMNLVTGTANPAQFASLLFAGFARFGGAPTSGLISKVEILAGGGRPASFLTWFLGALAFDRWPPHRFLDWKRHGVAFGSADMARPPQG